MSTAIREPVSAGSIAPRREIVPLQLEPTRCCVCPADAPAEYEPLAVGEDFEYRTSADYFLAVRCRRCGLVYLNPRPAESELSRIYPANYHAFDFSGENFGWAFRARCWLETRRLLSICRGLGPRARVLDIGCGDGFHLQLLRQAGSPDWVLEGVDALPRAVAGARRRGLTVHEGTLESLSLPSASYDLALLIATLEHVADPVRLLTEARRVLKPGGRLLIVTDNTATLDFWWFKRRHWGGYHFPRHWQLFNRHNLRLLADRAGLETLRLRTITSPVNWVYSFRNMLDDWQAPRWLVECFSLRSVVSLSLFTLADRLSQLVGRGALLQATVARPLEDVGVGACSEPVQPATREMDP